VETIQSLKQRHPQVQAMALTSYEDGQTVMAAVQAGARGYLLKTAEGRQLRQAIGAVGAGRTFLMPEAAEALVHMVGQPTTPGADITVREREVLSEIAQGKSNMAIAESLFLTKRAVEKHINAIFLKLGLANAEDVSKRVTAALMLLSEPGRVQHQPTPH